MPGRVSKVVLVLTGIFCCTYGWAQDQAKAYFDQGYEAYDEGDYQAAVDLYSSAIREDVNNAVYYYHRGVCYSLMSNNSQAVVDFDQAIALDLSFGDAYFERAYSYYVMENNEEALKDYDKAIELLPDYGPAYLNRGSVKFDMDDMEGACLDWKKAVILDMEIAQDLVNEYCPSKS